MATSDPNAGLADWADLYGHNQGMMVPATAMRQPASMPDLTVVNTATSGSGMTGPTSSPPSHANMEAARVGKSPRRRSRASRRAPVTLLNTDTSNFRAMVQQFTGIPSGPYSSGSLPVPGSSNGSGPTISFGLDFSAPARPSGAVMSFGQLQPQQYQRQAPFQEQVFPSQQQQQQHQYQYGTNTFAPGEFNSTNNNDMFAHGFGNDGIFVESMSDRMMPKAANSATNMNGDGYFG